MSFRCLRNTHWRTDVSELGLVSHILHGHGNNAADYPSLEFKNVLGLMLFTIIAVLLYLIATPWLNLGSEYSMPRTLPRIRSHTRAHL